MTPATPEKTVALLSRFVADGLIVAGRVGQPRAGSSDKLAYVLIWQPYPGGGIAGCFYTARYAPTRGTWGTTHTMAEAIYYLSVNAELPELSSWRIIDPKAYLYFDPYRDLRRLKLADLKTCIGARRPL
jgi:hypothetical protein